MADSRYLLKLSNSNKSKCFSVAKQLESQGLVVDTNYAQDEHIIIVTASNEKLAHTVSFWLIILVQILQYYALWSTIV